ncbi:hypothetical protein SORBI_3004G204000 [Sorghum bicolor]|uniref:TF-B3 domain-containing protein n=1 Tax=Sorghum bicolor TaxID=4558 RepID=A0A1Z5RNC3_SORBI|nr:hypothetical protein SORBI_3004G204000 [Sorghum bicolor]
MIGSAPDSARRKPSHDRANDEVRHGDTVVKNTKRSADAFTEKRKKKDHLYNANHGKDRDIRNGDQRIKKSRVPAASSEKGREKGDHDLNKTSSKKKMMGVDLDKKRTVTSRRKKLERERKKKLLINASIRKNMQRDDGEEGRIMSNYYETKVKSKKVSTTLSDKERNKEKLNKTHREKKMQAADSKMRNHDSGVNKGKVSTTFCDKEKKRKRPSNTNSEKETAPITYAVKEKKMRTTESVEIKMRHDRQNRRNVSLDVSNEKMDTSSGSNYKIRKRKLAHTLLKEKKRMRYNDSDKIHSGRVKEMEKISGGKEKNNQAPIAFLKFIRNNSEKFLVIPPTVAPRLEYLTNQLVYLKDSEGKCSKVLVSKVAETLVFHQGWDIFVSNHLIKWGEFLLFEYIAESTFSVRVFRTDSCERVDFNPESTNKGGRKKQAWSNMPPDDLVITDGSSQNIDDGYYVSGECPRTKVPQTCHVTCNTKNDPKQVEHVVGSGVMAQDNNGKSIDPQCKTKGTSPLCSKGKTLITLIDSEDSEPLEHENGDTMKLATSVADSDTSLVAVNTNEGPIRAQSGIGNGPSVVLGDEKGSSPEIECGTKSISTTCSEGKTRSQIIITSTALLDLHDSDEDLGRKQRTNVVPLDSITPVIDYHNHSKTDIIQNLYRKYEAPGGFRCLEKWRKDVVNNQASLDCTVPIKPENPQKNDSMLVDGYGSIELNPVDEYICSEGNHECVQPLFTMPIKEPSSADRVTNCGHDGTEIDYSINEKDGGASVLLEAKGERLEPMGSIVHSQSNNAPLCANPVVPGPIEKTSSPDEISKCSSSMIEIEHNVNEKGTPVQFETQMDQVEPVRSSVRSKSRNIVVRANESEHCFSKQEGRMPSNTEVPEPLLPMKDKILELDYHSPPEINSQLCIPDTTQKWLGLSKSLSSAVIRQRRHHWDVVMLKDPMKRLWPIIYHDNPIFVGFTAGWKHFVAANNLQTGDVCELIKESEDDEPVYSVRMCGKI